MCFCRCSARVFHVYIIILYSFDKFFKWIPAFCGLNQLCFSNLCLNFHGSISCPSRYIWPQSWGWVGLWGFLWWAPSAKRKDHHGVSSGWSSVWHRSKTGPSSTQYEQIPIILGVWPFWLTPFFFRSITFGGLMVKLYFLCWNYSLSSGWHYCSIGLCFSVRV